MRTLFLLLLSATMAQATTRTAASCSLTDVQTQITASSVGDTVLVPAGAACDWTAGISISGIQLIGAGSSTSGTVITAGMVTITKNATNTTRLSAFRFSGTDVHVTTQGSTSARAYIIDNCYFFSSGGNIAHFNANGAVVHHNTFFMNPSTAGGPDVLPMHPAEDWSAAPTFGANDTQGPQGGERNFYFEDNTFQNILETGPDGDQGIRLVIRHNTYQDSSIVFHSGGGQIQQNDTSTFGTRQYEVYSNTFSRVSGCNNVNKWIWSRGGSGVIANNSMDLATLQGGGPGCGFNGVEIKLGVGCNGTPNTYPIPYQQGQSSYPPTVNPPTLPLLIFGNVAGPHNNGPGDPSFISVQQNNTGGASWTQCSTPGTYVQAGRDYKTSNAWGWVAFTYPHPLASGTPQAGTPVCTPGGGGYIQASLSISCTNPSSAPVECSTVDGSTPTTDGASGCTHGSVVSGTITVNPAIPAVTLNVVAGGSGFTDSAAISNVYLLQNVSPAPTILARSSDGVVIETK